MEMFNQPSAWTLLGCGIQAPYSYPLVICLHPDPLLYLGRGTWWSQVIMVGYSMTQSFHMGWNFHAKSPPAFCSIPYFQEQR